MANTPEPIPPHLFPKTPSTQQFEAFKKLTSESIPIHYPLSTTIEKNIPIYHLPAYSSLSSSTLSALQAEWNHILLHGPGIFITKNLYPDKALISSVTSTFSEIIAHEALQAQQNGQGGNTGDHFGTSTPTPTSTSTRIWNSLTKHCLHSPSTFFAYYSNPYIPLIATSWLGPAHRLTAQVNLVPPGAPAQKCHRDYHLGFQSPQDAATYPIAVHHASQFLTLQGAVAHVDMPLASGPTRVLPFSQMCSEGYVGFHDERYRGWFEERYVAVGMEMGDGVWFNPALFHAAGENVSGDVQRVANLMQVSVAFGRAMESLDGRVVVERTWELLRGKVEREGLSAEVRAFIGNVVEGYAFPTNLDRRPPGEGGLAPESEQQLLVRALKEGWEKGRVMDELERMRVDSLA